jgi:hypothetical protein
MIRKTTLFRQLIEDDEILIQPGVHGSSARLVPQMGINSATSPEPAAPRPHSAGRMSGC